MPDIKNRKKRNAPMPARREGRYWVYMLECRNGSYYTGYAADIVKRYRQHVLGRQGARYTRGFRVERLARCWYMDTSRGDAMRVEYFIKSQDRRFKEEIVEDPARLGRAVRKALDIRITSYDPERVMKACGDQVPQ